MQDQHPKTKRILRDIPIELHSRQHGKSRDSMKS
jgi:hypothetical protein